MPDMISTYRHLFAAIGIDQDAAEGAAAYYTLLIRDYPTNLTAIKRGYREWSDREASGAHLFDINNGKEELFKNGYLAEILLQSSNIYHEKYLPIPPDRIWEANKEVVAKKYPEFDLNEGQEHVNKLTEEFKKFGPLGIWIKEGDITILYHKPWFYEFLIHNLKADDNLCLMLSALGSFKEPNLSYYRSMLERNLKIRLLYDREAFRERKSETDGIEHLLGEYKDNFEFKFTPITHVTSRRVISDNFAIDARKKLPENAGSNHNSTYVGTIYTQKKVIEFLRNNFDSAWGESEGPK